MTRNIGDSVTIPAREVAKLWSEAGLSDLRQRKRGQDVAFDRILDDLAHIAVRWSRTFASERLADAGVTNGVDSEASVTVAQAAEALRRTPAAVRLAIREGRLRASRVGRQWMITGTDLVAHMEAGNDD